MSLAESKNFRTEDGTWPHSETWAEWKRQEWHSERLSLELIDMLKTVKGVDHRLVESMADAISVSNGNLTVVVVISAPDTAKDVSRVRGPINASKRKQGAFKSNSHPRIATEQEN